MLELKSVKKIYHNELGDDVALNGITLKLGNRGLVFLYGARGEGKTTLMNVLAGLEEYDGGNVAYNGLDFADMTKDQKLAYLKNERAMIFDGGNLIDRLTVYENVALGREAIGEQVSEEEVLMALRKQHIEKFAYNKLSDLSDVQQQRVVIARAMLQNPKVVFVNEPTKYFDKRKSQMYWKAIKKLSEDVLVLAITYNREIVETLGDRVITIAEGKVLNDRYISEDLRKEDREVFSGKEENEQTAPAKKMRAKVRHGFKASTYGKLRYVAMFLVSMLLLLSFSMSYMVYAYKQNETLASIAANTEQGYVSLSKKDNTEVQPKDYAKMEGKEKINVIHTANLELTFSRQVPKNNGIDMMKGFAEVTQDGNKNSLGQEVLYGTYPTANNKVAISDYMATLMSNYGILCKTSESSDLINFSLEGIQNLIGKIIKIGDSWCEVAAIYKTNYKEYANVNTLLPEDKEMFATNFKNIYSIVHVAPGKANALTPNNSYQVVLSIGETLASRYEISTLSGTYNLIGDKESLAAKEVVIPYTLFNEIFKVNIDLTTAMEMDSVLTSAMQSDKVNIKTQQGYTNQFTVVGVSTEGVYFAAGEGEGTYGSVLLHANYPVMNVAYRVDSVSDLANTLDNLSNYNLAYVGDEYSSKVEDIYTRVDSMRLVIYILTLIIGIFAILFTTLFYIDVTNRERRFAKVLKNLGVTKADILKIFLSSALLTTLAILVCGLALSVVGVVVANAIVAGAVPATVFAVSFPMLGYTLLLGVVLSLLDTVLPVLLNGNRVVNK